MIPLLNYLLSVSNFFIKSMSFFTPSSGHRIVDAGAHASYCSVSGQIYQPSGFRFCDEFFVEIFVACDEYHVHEGAVFKGYRAVIKRAVVDKVIKRGRLFFIVLLNGGHTACFFIHWNISPAI